MERNRFNSNLNISALSMRFDSNQTIPHLLIVAGVAYFKESTSKIKRTPDGIFNLSPLGNVKVLLSSNTLFNDSTQTGSISPSKTTHVTLLLSAEPATLSWFNLRMIPVNNPSDEDTSVLNQVDLLAQQFDLTFTASQLNKFDLRRNSTKNILGQSVELIKTTPTTNRANTHKQSGHGLEIKRFVTVENQRHPTQILSQCLNGFRLTCPCRTKWRTTITLIQSCNERDETVVQ
ncbi:hypothetical protein WICPIJ_007810 [Wickerhamomyces pijperi]|uniref:Uncharacterized protein n=1 Tax=Wickerhamomyces pijperi TaxID=599730 RepID=A0A9P8PZ42_WICPI|nr:hypothetical protein WICPIJ_007810 [Wickerhamomyces pijperi]